MRLWKKRRIRRIALFIPFNIDQYSRSSKMYLHSSHRILYPEESVFFPHKCKNFQHLNFSGTTTPPLFISLFGRFLLGIPLSSDFLQIIERKQIDSRIQKSGLDSKGLPAIESNSNLAKTLFEDYSFKG